MERANCICHNPSSAGVLHRARATVIVGIEVFSSLVESLYKAATSPFEQSSLRITQTMKLLESGKIRGSRKRGEEKAERRMVRQLLSQLDVTLQTMNPQCNFTVLPINCRPLDET